MPRYNDVILQAIPCPALITANGHVVQFNPPAQNLFPDLSLGDPIPDPLCVPDCSTAFVLAGNSGWNLSASPLPEGSLLLLQPSRLLGLTDAQLGGIVRRLREQMAHLLLSAQLLGQALPEQDHRLGSMNRTLCQMMRLIDQIDLLHDISNGIYPFRPVVLDLAGLCRQVSCVSASLLESRKITLTFETPITSALVSGSSELLQKLLLELISNAARAAGQGGALHLTLSRQSQRYILTLSGNDRSDSDRPLIDLLNANDSPQRIPTPGEGAGIGLTLVQHILRLHDGVMVMERQQGVRTAISLPMVKSAPTLSVNTPHAEHNVGFPMEAVALSDLLTDDIFTHPEL